MREQHGNENLTPAERELEAALTSLTPAAAQIDAVAAAFDAGGRAARRAVNGWRFATAAMLLVAVGGWLIPLGRAPDHAGETIIATSPAPTVVVASSPAPSPSSVSVLMLEHTVRERGVDALPPTDLPTIHNLRTSDLF